MAQAGAARSGALTRRTTAAVSSGRLTIPSSICSTCASGKSLRESFAASLPAGNQPPTRLLRDRPYFGRSGHNSVDSGWNAR